MSIVNILLGSTSLLMLSPILYYFGKEKFYEHIKNITLMITWHFGFLISLIGSIGSGKSSGQSALTHAYVLKFQKDIIDLMNKTKKVFKSIDFNDVDDYLFEAYSTKSIDFTKTVDELVDLFQIQKNLIFDFSTYKTTYEYFKDYAFAFYVIYIRNNYVYSVTKIFNRLTGNFNMKFDLNWQKIKKAYQTKNYAIEDYAVELIDEASDELASAFWRDVEKDDDGSKEYRRKYRHIHQERNRLIDTRQDATDYIKRFRNLTQTHLEMIEAKFIFTFKGLFKILESFMLSQMFLYKLFKLYLPFAWYKLPRLRKGMRYQEFYDDKYAYINKLRNKHNRILYYEWFLRSLGLVRFIAKKYYSAEDVGKINPDTHELLKLYFPASWSFGTYEQFAFKGIQEQLLQNAQSNQMEVNVFFQPSFFKDKELIDEKGVGEIDLY
jgi:hypothetical protein